MKTVKCPSCKVESHWENNHFRPFCSKYCKDKDLGRWANEEYRVPVEEEDGGVETKPESEKGKKGEEN
ncbi:MAG: DNA gyrase inhibitor YacG [Proteobacteria bacterium]|nr:DNA gyrase inhibitor YacG [Pseudomonadota bacterium]